MTTAWVLFSGALICLPWPAAHARSGRGRDAPGAAPTRNSRTGARLPLHGRGMPGAAAVVLVGCACVAVLGLQVGVLAALACCPLSWLALRALRLRPIPVRPDRAVALALDLAAAALHAGRPVADSLALAAPAAPPLAREQLLRVAGLLRLGAEPDRAWALVAADSPLAPVATVATRSASSGIRLAAAFERLAAHIRAEVGTAAAQRAHRAGITAMAPLAACFLPSFVCLGIIPVVIGIAESALGVLP